MHNNECEPEHKQYPGIIRKDQPRALKNKQYRLSRKPAIRSGGSYHKLCFLACGSGNEMTIYLTTPQSHVVAQYFVYTHIHTHTPQLRKLFERLLDAVQQLANPVARPPDDPHRVSVAKTENICFTRALYHLTCTKFRRYPDSADSYSYSFSPK